MFLLLFFSSFLVAFHTELNNQFFQWDLDLASKPVRFGFYFQEFFFYSFHSLFKILFPTPALSRYHFFVIVFSRQFFAECLNALLQN